MNRRFNCHETTAIRPHSLVLESLPIVTLAVQEPPDGLDLGMPAHRLVAIQTSQKYSQ
jgi:hypothetical protein